LVAATSALHRAGVASTLGVKRLPSSCSPRHWSIGDQYYNLVGSKCSFPLYSASDSEGCNIFEFRATHAIIRRVRWAVESTVNECPFSVFSESEARRSKGMKMQHDPCEIARASYLAYANKDRAAIDKLSPMLSISLARSITTSTGRLIFARCCQLVRQSPSSTSSTLCQTAIASSSPTKAEARAATASATAKS
jgi:hypothetical protein